MTSPESSRKWAADRLASLPTVAKVFAGSVGDLTPIRTDQLRRYIDQLPLPAGWLRARLDGPAIAQPLRMAVYPTPEGGWEGCETLAVFGFTGTAPSVDLVCELTEQTLRSLAADNVTASSQRMLPIDGRTTQVRCSGEIDLAGERVWLQHTIYLADAQPPEVKILVEHTILAAAAHQDHLREDIKTLSNRCYGAIASIRDAVRQPEAQAAFEAEVPTLRVQPYDDMGIPSILVNANRNGMRLLQKAGQGACASGEGSFTVDGVTHRIVRQADAAQLEITRGSVTWFLGDAQMAELLDMLEPLIIFWNPAHNYFDLDLGANDPVEQLVLAVDEYVGIAPYGEFPELSTESGAARTAGIATTSSPPSGPKTDG